MLCQIAVDDSTTVLTHWRSIKTFPTFYVLLTIFFLQSCSAEQKIWFLFGLQPLGQTFGVTAGSSY